MSVETPEDRWVEDVLRFWFEALEPSAWFVKNETIDATIRSRFQPSYEALANELPASAATSARDALAAVIVFDQFPRNMFRGTARAFATDAKALAVAEEAISRGLDRQLSVRERQFLYMPFQHSESRSVQARSVELFASLADPEVMDFAYQHKAVIDRFGRFPHRNVALGRISTTEEIAFLQEPGSTF
jgi:uncharacterized protein (DUF924 family)